MRKNLIITSFVSVFLFSCSDELLTPPTNGADEVSSLTARGREQVIDGRFYFPSKEDLQTTFDELKVAEEEDVAAFIDQSGITSLRPVVTEGNEEEVYAKIINRVNNLKNNPRFMATNDGPTKVSDMEEMIDEINDIEEIIGDDVYGALLNSDAEIQVGEDIYKYTDVGLFKVAKENYRTLLTYLENNKIADNMLYRTESAISSDFRESRYMLNHSIMTIEDPNNGIYYNPGSNIPPYSGGGGGGGGSSSAPPVTDSNSQLANLINSLPDCDTYTTHFFKIYSETLICVKTNTKAEEELKQKLIIITIS